MNLLATVMGMLLIFACIFSASLHKQILAKTVHHAYQANVQANQKIMNRCETVKYQQMRGERKKREGKKAVTKKRSSAVKPTQGINPECSRLNLWPLVSEGIDAHPLLYLLACKLVKKLYGPALFEEKRGMEGQIIHEMVAAAHQVFQEGKEVCLESLSLSPSSRWVFYRMLKGTKKGPYPSLLEVVSLNNRPKKLCIAHASCELLQGVLGDRQGSALYQKLRDQEQPFSSEDVEKIIGLEIQDVQGETLATWIDWNREPHKIDKEMILVQEEGEVCLKKKISL